MQPPMQPRERPHALEARQVLVRSSAAAMPQQALDAASVATSRARSTAAEAPAAACTTPSTLATSAQLAARQTHAGRSFVPPATAGRQPSALLHQMSRSPRRSTAARPTLGQSSASMPASPTPPVSEGRWQVPALKTGLTDKG